MLIATPLLNGQSLHPDVICAVAKTGLEWVVVGGRAEYPDYPREYSINHTRAVLQSALSSRDFDYVLLMDSDVVLPNCDIIAQLIAMLDAGFIAACIRTKTSDDGHVVAACALVRGDVYKTNLRYMDDPKTCQCLKLAQIGPVGYVDGITTHEITRN